jgi:hypothetical protein
MADPRVLNYEPPGPVAKAFLESNAFIRGIMGPIGSGKTTAAIIDMVVRAAQQRPGPDGKRRTRFAVIRNTYPDLKNTSLKSWLDWVPADAGKLNMNPPITHKIQAGDVDMEVLFLALDRDEDVRKLLSLELTGAWVNEARYIPKGILDALTGRVGRYPAMRDGGPTWSGIILDTNPPDTESWWYRMAEKTDPAIVEEMARLQRELFNMGALKEGQPLVEFFKQPSGLAPNAENIKNLRQGYYHFAAAGKDEDYVKVYIHGEYGYVVEGKPVYPMYRDRLHCHSSPVEPVEGLPILLGADFGLTPAATFGQRLANGRWILFDELVTDNCGITRFAELLSSFAASRYPWCRNFRAWGDPAGNETRDDETIFDVLRRITGWKWTPAPSNDPDLRREAVIQPLNRLIDGAPGLLISPTMPVLRKGFISGYHYKFVRSSNGAVMHETPAKNMFSHVHDSAQYLMLGGGEYDSVRNKSDRLRQNRPRVATGVGEGPFGEPDLPRRGGRFQTQADIDAWRNRRNKPARDWARVASDDEDGVL